MFRTARRRLVGWNVLVLTIILVLLESIVYVVFSSQIYSGADQELENRQGIALRLIHEGGADFYAGFTARNNIDPTYRTVIAGSSGVGWSSDCPQLMFPPCSAGSYAATSQDAIAEVRGSGANDTDIRTVTFRGYPVRVLTFMAVVGNPSFSRQYVVQISRIASGEADALEHLQLLLVLGLVFGIVLSAVGSLFLANRALVPIRQAFSRQRQFTADASHELRTPLALIRANAEMLARHVDRLPYGDGELIGEIIGETDHLNRLVGDLLTLARADADSVRIETKPVDFRALVNEVHEDLQRIAESRGIASDISLNGPVTVSGDEVRLRQLVLILLDNALKYTDPGGRVDVSLDRQDNHARLVVSDTGIGIPDEDKPHIFDRFYRVDRAREHESGGTGLGLSIAQWIAQAHGGTIKVESTVGKGSRFLVDLPAA